MEYYDDIPADFDYATLETLKEELWLAIVESRLNTAVSNCSSIEELQSLFPTD